MCLAARGGRAVLPIPLGAAVARNVQLNLERGLRSPCVGGWECPVFLGPAAGRGCPLSRPGAGVPGSQALQGSSSCLPLASVCQPSAGIPSRPLRAVIGHWLKLPLLLQVQHGARGQIGGHRSACHSPAGPGTREARSPQCSSALCSSELGQPFMLPPSPRWVGWCWPGLLA